ncbi:MAG: helix-turn-helix domain-containing protein [Oligoflexales bacterium]|nr:helix-turn-helix domain-containing protein [Oligoflexales bacterium]
MSANLTYEQRCEIEMLIKLQYNVADIAKLVGVHNSTIYRELGKNSSSNGYKAMAAHKMAKNRAKKAGQAGKKDPKILKAAEDKSFINIRIAMSSYKWFCTYGITVALFFLCNTKLSAKLRPNHHHHNINKDSISEIERESPYIHTPIHIGFDGTLSLTFMHGHSSSHGLEYSVSPIFLINGDKIKRLVKLGEQKSPVPLPITDPNDGKGYRLIRKKAFDIGIGMAPHAGLLNVVGGIAAMGHRGKSKYYDRFIKDLSELDEPHHLKVPLSQEQLEDWKVGDQLVFAHIGGVSFHLFIGYDPFVFIGPAYRALGEWKVHLKKVDKNKIEYELVNEKIKSFGMEMEGTFTKLDVEKFHTKEKYFTFLFDLSKPDIPEIFKEVVQGDLKQAQKLSHESIPGLSLSVEGISESQGSRNTCMVSLPFLYGASASKNKVINTSFEKDLENGYTIKTNIALRERRSATFGRISKHKLKTDFFIATHEKSIPTSSIEFPDHFEEVDHEGASEIELTDDDREEKDAQRDEIYHQFGGTNKWVFESDQITGEELEHKIAKLARLSGFESLKYRFPNEKLGYVRVELSVMFSQGFLGKVLEIHPESYIYHELLDASRESIHKYFSKDSHANLCKNTSRKTCERDLIDESELLFKKIAKIIQKMRVSFAEHRYGSFVTSYSKLGKLITHNRFILQNFMKKFHEGVIVDFELHGEKFAHFKKIIKRVGGKNLVLKEAADYNLKVGLMIHQNNNLVNYQPKNPVGF